MQDLTWYTDKVLIKDLKDFEPNPRRMSKADFDRLVRDLQQDGYHHRIIVNQDNTIIGGHSRKKALLKAGFKNSDMIEVLKPSRALAEEEFKRINVKDNLPFGDFDFDILANAFEVDDLVEWGMPAEWLGKELDIESLSAEDEPVEGGMNAEPITKLGDVWMLGEHRLMCGDSTNADNVAKLMAEYKPNLMVTDPPYGVEYDASWRLEAGINKPWQKRAEGKVENDDRSDWRDTWSLFPGEVAYVWHGGLHAGTVQESLMSCGFSIRSQIIWGKKVLVMGRGHYHWQHEPCWYAARGTANWQGDRKQSTLWQIENMHRTQGNVDDGKTEHSTQKPIECMLRPIMNNSAIGEYVYDPFGGSGTTLIAAERSKRKCLMMELSPQYCDIIVKRWEKESGGKAVLEGMDEPKP